MKRHRACTPPAAERPNRLTNDHRQPPRGEGESLSRSTRNKLAISQRTGTSKFLFLGSSKSRKIDDVPYLQHSAAVNPGNSGGPLLDEFGRVAGIVTLKARLENVSFAIPVETVRTIFKSPGQ
jgi:hypothetical protein